MIKVIPITDQEQLAVAQSIRKRVFVDEQKVPLAAEIDEYEHSCHHLLALNEEGVPVGTARWRRTEKGVKLERFAVLKEARRFGVGSALLGYMLDDIERITGQKHHYLYLHSQVEAMFLYEKFGFTPVGEMFEECGIRHYKMFRQL